MSKREGVRCGGLLAYLPISIKQKILNKNNNKRPYHPWTYLQSELGAPQDVEAALAELHWGTVKTIKDAWMYKIINNKHAYGR